MITIQTCDTDQNIQELAQCAVAIWNEYFINIISQEQIDYMVERFQSYPALKKAMEEEGYTYYLCFDESTCIGYCGVRKDEHRLFLSKFYMSSTYRGKGLSSRLFENAKQHALEHDCEAIYLTCNKYNQHSLDVYKHYGFQCIDSIQTDIGNGFIMDDFVLQLSL